MRVNQVLYAQSLQQLARHPRAVRLGPVSQVAIIRAFASLEALRNATDAELASLKRTVQESAIAARNLLNEIGTDQFEEPAARLIEQHDDANIRIAVIGDGDYPEILSTAVDAPPSIYWRGSLAGIFDASAAVVGTREPTPLGVKVAEQVSRHLASAGVAVVSGLALGIDTVAHQAALNGGGYTVAVLAQPLDQISPQSNRGLAEQIVEAGGALISEHPLGSETDRFEFARRDRIQSGLSRVVIPIQTGLKGGTQNTIEYAKKQGRLIWAPHVEAERGHEKWAGIDALIQSGVARAFTSDDYSSLVTSARDGVNALFQPSEGPRPLEGATLWD
jgi:DNA processing protein